MKSFLFVMRHPPHGDLNTRESLDMLMTVAAFDHPVRVLLLDDGVFLLKSGQTSQADGLKSHEPILQALELYDIEGLWVEEESLAERGLAKEGLILPAHAIPRNQIAEFVNAASFVVTC